MNLKSLLLSSLILAVCLGVNVVDYTSEYDLIEDLKDNDGKIYVLFFYASTNLHPLGYEASHQHFHSQQELAQRNQQEHDSILSFADTQNDVLYNEFDVINIQHDSLLHVIGVEKREVFAWPVTVVMQNGVGHQVTGPNQVYFVKRIVTNFQKPGSSPVQNGVQNNTTPQAKPAQPQQNPVPVPKPTPAPAQNKTTPNNSTASNITSPTNPTAPSNKTTPANATSTSNNTAPSNATAPANATIPANTNNGTAPSNSTTPITQPIPATASNQTATNQTAGNP